MASIFVSHSSSDHRATEQVCGRLRSWGYDSLFLDFDPEDGIAVGRAWEHDLYWQLRVADAVLFVASAASVSSRWCFAELALARSARKPIFPVAIEPGVRLALLEDRQWLDVTGGAPAWWRLREALRAQLDPQDVFAWDRSRSPYPGLAPFQVEDAAVFFGREDMLVDVLGRLDATLGRGRCVAVIGPSGSGKSSLVRAGVIPRLRRLNERWVALPPLTPGDRPVAALGRALATGMRAAGYDGDRSALQRRIESEPAAFAEVLRDLAIGPDGQERSVLVVVDQAEELIVLADAQERARL